MMVISERSNSNISKYTPFKIQNIFFYIRNEFLGEKLKNCRVFFCSFFSKYLQKISDFVNSDDCIGKVTLESIRLQPVLFKGNLKLMDNRFFLVEKSGNCIYDYAHSFFEKDFYSDELSWYNDITVYRLMV